MIICFNKRIVILDDSIYNALINEEIIYRRYSAQKSLKEREQMIRIAICDDEPSAIQSLEGQIASFFYPGNMKYSVSGFLDGEALLNSLIDRKEHFDIIFLDIQMNKINGMDAAKAIRNSAQENVFIIFVTALREYVFDAFDVSAANYLVKPVETQKLHAVLQKTVAGIIPSEKQYLILHKGSEVKKIPFCSIMYCEVVNHRVFIYEQKNTHEYAGKIDDLEQRLNDGFFRCHRSFIVNLKYVDSYKDGVAYLPSEERIPIATRRQKPFMTALLNYQRKEVR